MDRNYDAASGYGVVLVTAASQQEAEAIATSLVKLRLAACVSSLKAVVLQLLLND